jgi:hypothetical protein
VLEIRNVDGRLHIAREVRKPDELEPPVVEADHCRTIELDLFTLAGNAARLPPVLKAA